MTDFAGQEFANQHGYSLNYFSPGKDKHSAVYTKQGIALKVFQDGKELTGELYFSWRTLVISSGRFSIPGNFHVFERDILLAATFLTIETD